MNWGVLCLQVGSSSSDLILTVRLDQQTVWHGNVPSTFIQHSFADQGSHELEIELSNKQPHHTVISNQGEIQQDAVIEVQSLRIANIDVTSVLMQKSQYYHDFNGSQPLCVDDFSGVMGCNGVVKFSFQSPIYNWLLEN